MDFRSTSIFQIKENDGFRDPWNCETVHAMSLYIFYVTVVTEFRGDLETVMRPVCVPVTFAKVPTERGTDWSLKHHKGILKQ